MTKQEIINKWEREIVDLRIEIKKKDTHTAKIIELMELQEMTISEKLEDLKKLNDAPSESR